MSVKMVFVLFGISILSFCQGFLLPPNNTATTVLTDEHFTYIMGLLGQEKGNAHKMEQLILKLNSEVVSLKQQVNGLNQRNESSQLQIELMQIKRKLMQVENYNYALNKDNERLQSEVNLYRNQTMNLKSELESFSHSVAAGDLSNMTQLQSSVENLENTISVTTTKLNAVTSTSNARSQDFLALLNRTKDMQHRITTVETDSRQTFLSYQNETDQKINDAVTRTQQTMTAMTSETRKTLLEYQNITNQKISDAFQKITEISHTVALFSCVDGDNVTFPKDSILYFNNTKTVYGISDVSEFKNSGKFTCEVAGMYLFSVFINSKTNPSEFQMFKNKYVLSYVYIVRGENNGDNYHTGTGVLAVRLDVGDTLYVKPFYDKMYVHGTDSCMTVIKIK